MREIMFGIVSDGGGHVPYCDSFIEAVLPRDRFDFAHSIFAKDPRNVPESPQPYAAHRIESAES